MKNKIRNKKTNNIKSTKSNKINFDKSYEPNMETSYILCKDLKEEIMYLKIVIKELQEVIKAKSILQSADKIKGIKFKISKVRFKELTEVISKSKEFFTIDFHGFDILGTIQSDNVKEKNLEDDASFPSSSDIKNIRSNDSDTQ